MRRLNNLLRNDQWITEEIKKEIKKYLQINENEHNNPKPMQIIKTVLRGKITANQAYFRKQEKSQINNLKQLERGQTKHSRRKEIIKFRAEIETKNNRKVYEIKSWFFGKINKIDKLLTRFLKEEKEKGPKSTKSEMKKKLQPTSQKYKGS